MTSEREKAHLPPGQGADGGAAEFLAQTCRRIADLRDQILDESGVRESGLYVDETAFPAEIRELNSLLARVKLSGSYRHLQKTIAADVARILTEDGDMRSFLSSLRNSGSEEIKAVLPMVLAVICHVQSKHAGFPVPVPQLVFFREGRGSKGDKARRKRLVHSGNYLLGRDDHPAAGKVEVNTHEEIGFLNSDLTAIRIVAHEAAHHLQAVFAWAAALGQIAPGHSLYGDAVLLREWQRNETFLPASLRNSYHLSAVEQNAFDFENFCANELRASLAQNKQPRKLLWQKTIEGDRQKSEGVLRSVFRGVAFGVAFSGMAAFLIFQGRKSISSGRDLDPAP